jgi:hypothetical protein
MKKNYIKCIYILYVAYTVHKVLMDINAILEKTKCTVLCILSNIYNFVFIRVREKNKNNKILTVNLHLNLKYC